MAMITVEVDLDEFNDDDLIAEVEDRGHKVVNEQVYSLLTDIWHARRTGRNPEDVDRMLDQLIYKMIGKIV